MSVESHETVCTSVSPGLAERTWGNAEGIHTVDVPIVDVESWHTQVLIVESVEKISTKLQAETLVEFKVLGHGQIQLIAGHGAVRIAALCAGERIAAADRVNRKRVVYDEVDIRRIDQRTGSCSRQCGALAGADVDQLRCADVTPRRVEWSAGIAEQRTARVGADQRVIEAGIAVRITVVCILVGE